MQCETDKARAAICILRALLKKVGNEETKDADHSFTIESDYCYQIQETNELGDLIESDTCMIFDKNIGSSFDEALKKIKPDLEIRIRQLIENEKSGSNYDADKIITRQQHRPVKNSPNEELEFIVIEIYMYSFVYKDYILIDEFCVIDSKGNLYHIVGPIGG